MTPRLDPPASNPRHRVALLRAASLLAAVASAACGGSGGSTSAPPPMPEYQVVSGGGACGSSGCGGDSADGSGADGGDGAGGGLGQMRNAKVTVSKPDGTLLGAAALQNNLVSLYPRAYTGPVILQFGDDGSGNGQYYDEALQAWVAFGSTTLHVMVPSLTHHVSANVLTETAYQYLKQSPNFNEVTTIDAPLITQVNNAVRDAFNARVPAGFQISDITNYAVAVSDGTVANSLPNTHAGRYGVLLAAVTRTAQAFNPALSAPALAFMSELIADMLDDNTINASVVAPAAYDVEVPQSLAATMVSARADYGAPDQPAVPTSVPTLCFNPALFAVNSNWYITNQVTDAQQQVTQQTLAFTVNPLTSFQGNAGVLDVAVAGYSGSTSAGTPTFTLHSYYDPDLSRGLVNYGNTAALAQGSSLAVYNPPYTDTQFLLQPGDQEVLTSQETFTTFDPQGNVVGTPTVIALSLTTTFAGYESVTAPSGQVFNNACRYDTVDASGTQTSTWITSSGQGVPVKSVTIDASGATTQTTQYVSGNVNGTVIH